MKADISRSSFDPTRHFRQVLRQQGRVDLDADWNEQQDIVDHLRSSTGADLLGPAGGPASAAAFGLTISSDGKDLLLSNGHYYVDGYLLENEGLPSGTSVWKQPDLPAKGVVHNDDGSLKDGPATAGRYLAFVHAWDLHRTALEENHIREVALGGADTTTRLKTVWQVGLLRLGDVGGTGAGCDLETAGWKALTAASTGLLEVRTDDPDEGSGPCYVPATGGFRGPENQHYRVEIHQGGPAATATAVWARDNAATAASWVSGPDSEGFITVADPGRDGVVGFTTGMTVELTDDTRELLGRPGKLVRLADVRGNRLKIDGLPATLPDDLKHESYPAGPRVRRWDSQGTVPVATGADEWSLLESGIRIRFAQGVTYRTGDYWLVPARTRLGDVIWPRTADGKPRQQPPKGIRHRFAKLATVSYDGAVWSDVHDCRELFPDLTQLMTLRAVSGDGQTVQAGAALVIVPAPLVVGVSNGGIPVKGAKVRFTVTRGGGTLSVGTPPVVTTNDQGLASVDWSVDSGTDVQIARAELLDRAGNPTGLPVDFTASLLTAHRTAYDGNNTCPDLLDVTTVQDAIDKLCVRPSGGLPKQEGVQITDVGPGRQPIEPDPTLPMPAFGIMASNLEAGIVVTVSEALDPATVTRLNCFVVLDLPYPLTSSDMQQWETRGIAGYQAITLDGDVTYKIEAGGSDEDVYTLVWTPTDSAATLVRRVQTRLVNLQLDPVLWCRLVVKGNTIMSSHRDRYLDGDVFLDPETRRSNLRMPSGDDRNGGTFELWFTVKHG
ncbi:hypothetical protein J7E93_21810 [Streptomyces sp. ISL-36]|nr:hypothetical protein [Streptomyces sp. ISL-36]